MINYKQSQNKLIVSIKYAFGSSIVFLSLLFLSQFLSFNAQCQNIKVENVSFTSGDNTIEIYYDLLGNVKHKYKVSVVLKRTGAPDFIVKPASLTGAVGKGYFAGGKRKIVWNYRRDYQPDPNVTDYYFEVTAQRVKSTWLYYAGGVVVAGAAAVLFLMPSSSGESDTGMPYPPNHP